MELQTPRGTRDVYGAEALLRLEVIRKMRKVVESYGFKPIETPAFESFDLLALKSGEEIKNQIYVFEDKGGRQMGLRFDGTIPVARVVASNPALPKPIRFYYVEPFWRYEEPQAGRYREFWQIGVEFLGPSFGVSDAETIASAVDCLKIFGLQPEVKINNRKILQGFAQELGVKDAAAFFRIVDKKDKIEPDELERELRKLGLEKEAAARVLRFVNLKGDIGEEMREFTGLMLDGLTELRELSKLLREYDIKAVTDFGLARGLDYYTSIIFEITVGDKLAVAGGGRYDDLIGVYSKQGLPATGWGLGIDRLVQVLQKQGKAPKIQSSVDAIFIPLEEEALRESIKLANALRGFKRVEIEPMERGLSKSLEYAGKEGIKYAVIIGKNELTAKIATVRNLVTGEEKKVKIGEVKQFFAELKE